MLTEEAVNIFKFLGLEPSPTHHGETYLEGGTAETDKELNSKIHIMKKNSWIQDQEKHQDKEQELDMKTNILSINNT